MTLTVNRPIPADKNAVDTILGLAQLPMAEDEYAQLVRTYALYREQAAALRIPEARYAQPADIYPALEHQ